MKEDVRTMLLWLRESGSRADIKRNEFSVTSIKLLGLITSTEDIAMDSDKVTVIRD
jgi:hypothetical protein